MNGVLHQEVLELKRVYRDISNYTLGYLILKRLVTITEIIGLKNFDEDFRHIYRSAYGFIDYPPNNEEDESHLIGLQREVNYLIPIVELYLRNL